MNRSELFQSLTLWFAAMIFLRTGSGNSHPAVMVAAIVAVGVTYLVPVYLLTRIVNEVTE